MIALTTKQVEEGLVKGKLSSDEEITNILDIFEKRQPRIYKLIYEDLSDSILAINQDMSNLFLDLSFDVIWLYQLYYADVRVIAKTDFQPLIWRIKDINSEYHLGSLADRSLRAEIKSYGEPNQPALIAHLQNAVKKYATFKLSRGKAIAHTINMLLVIIIAMNKAYDNK